MAGWRKLGLIAGGGELPVLLAEHCAAAGKPYFVARVAPFADAPELDQHPGATHGLGQMGVRIAALHEAGCDAVVMIGRVPRVDLRTLEWDDGGRAMIPALAAAAPQGDDALLRAVLHEHEKHGFRMIGAEEAMADLLAPAGAWGALAPGLHLSDLAHAARIAGAIGALDIGQGAVVCAGLVLAVEAQEGTDAMLHRVAWLPANVRGVRDARRGVLVKRPKPIQERRIDLPVIGVKTIEAAAAAGLAGVAVEAEGALVARRADVIAAADAAGLFVYGFTRAEVGETLSGRIFLVAAESSGDALGADLARALKERDASLELMGVGGPLMAEEGLPSRADISGLAVLGFFDGLLAYKRVKSAVAATVKAVLEAKPDVVVLIDSWGFTLRVALGVRAAAPQIKLVKYVGPQVWASRPGRAKTLAAAVDHLICIHEFEAPFYEPYNLPCTVCGHPALGRFKPGDGQALRARQGFKPKEKVILVLPGSRPAEIRRVGPTLWRAAEMLDRERPDVRLIVVAARAVRHAVVSQAPASARIIEEPEKEDAFAAATVALAASGTVTTEVALQGTPVIVGYKLGWLTWLAARAFLFKGKYATLMNVAADAEVAPELIQTRFTAENIAAAAAPILDDEAAREEQVRRQDEALALMGRGGTPAAEIAADAVLGVMRGSLTQA